MLQSTGTLRSGESEHHALVQWGAALSGLQSLVVEWRVTVKVQLATDQHRCTWARSKGRHVICGNKNVFRGDSSTSAKRALQTIVETRAKPMSNEKDHNGDTQNGHRGSRWTRTETTDALVHGTHDGTHHSHPKVHTCFQPTATNHHHPHAMQMN